MALAETDTLSDALEYADRWLGFRQRLLQIPGVQVAVLVDDTIRLAGAHGHADVERAIALTPRHLFRIASHSKTFTATAVLQLVERGHLRLDDRVGDRLPSLAGTTVADRTVRALLSHASGITRDGADADHWELARAFPGPDQLLALAADPRSAVLETDVRFKYSNIAYSLLGAIVAEVTGQPYNAYVRSEIVERLGLTDLGPEFEPARASEYAVGYSSLAYADTRLPIEHVDTRAMSAATGFYGTAVDVVRYAAAHFAGDERLLSEASKRIAQHEHWAVEGADHYGLGFVVEHIGERRLVGHSGGFPGHITDTAFDPLDRLAVSVFTNAIDGPARALLTGVLRLIDLAGRPAPPALTSSSAPAAPAGGLDPHRFAGRFAGLWGVVDMVVLGSRIYAIDPAAEDPAGHPTEFEVVDQNTLRVVDSGGFGAPGETARFTFDADRTTVRSLISAAGHTLMPLADLVATLAGKAAVTTGWASVPVGREKAGAEG